MANGKEKRRNEVNYVTSIQWKYKTYKFIFRKSNDIENFLWNKTVHIVYGKYHEMLAVDLHIMILEIPMGDFSIFVIIIYIF